MLRSALSSALVLSLAGVAFAQSGGSGWTSADRKATYAPDGKLVLAADCASGPGYDLTLRLPGPHPGPWEEGQSMEVSTSSGFVPLANLSGAIVDSPDAKYWMLRARVGSNNPVMSRLFGGGSVLVSAGRESYEIDAEGGKAALASLQQSCQKKK